MLEVQVGLLRIIVVAIVVIIIRLHVLLIVVRVRLRLRGRTLVVQTLDLHRLGDLEEIRQILVFHIHLAAVHEVQETGHVVAVHVRHE